MEQTRRQNRFGRRHKPNRKANPNNSKTQTQTPISLMATTSRFSTTKPVLLLLLLILLSTLHQSSSSPYRNLKILPRNSNQIPGCREMVSRSQCMQNPKCRWCRSEALDDMCFTKLEAWRLPQQVFACDSWFFIFFLLLGAFFYFLFF